MNCKQILSKLSNKTWFLTKQYKIIIYLLFFLLTKPHLTVSANSISEDSAKIKAEHFFANKKDSIGRRSAMTSITPNVSCVKRGSTSKGGEATYYIFNRQKSPGFVIIAGDDNMSTIIGYSMENNINVDNMPEALTYMLDKYDLYVKDIRSTGKALSRRSVGPMEPGIPVIGPYIKTKWNQYAPYNWLTPIDKRTGEHTPTGCVPTAAAQILYYYKWPQNSFYRLYNWNDMQVSYGSGYGEAEGMAVATLIRDLGAIMGTSYGTGGSSTLSNAFTEIPGYICTETEDLEGSLAKGPLGISIMDQYKGFSHKVIMDGYDSNGLYHINWGWGGSCDGYYNMKDMAIIYNNKEIHPSIDTSYTYLLEPDYENEKCMAVPTAFGGVTIDSDAAKVGDKISVCLHNLGLFSGNDFNGYMSLFIYKPPKQYYDFGYYGQQVYGNEQYANPKYTDFEYSIPWDISQNGTDFNISLTLPNLSSDGDYVLVPVCFNILEKPEHSGVRGGNWRPLLHFADGTLVEDIPFEYKDGNYIFKDVAHGDFDIYISQIVTASAYHEKGRSSISSFIENKGSNNFTGTLTARFVNTNNANDIKTIDMALYVPANYSSRTTLNTSFDFTGSYCLKEIEVWKKLPTGDRKTYLKKKIDGTEFAILPKDSLAKTEDFYGKIRIGILWNDSKPYVNDSIYKYEELITQFNAYCYDIEDITANVELWAVPIGTGKSQLIKKDNCQIISQDNIAKMYTLYGTTSTLAIGSYRLVAFFRCGNNTSVMEQPNVIGEGYSDLEDYIFDNVFHVLDPEIDIPLLKLNSLKQTGNFYYQNFNYAEAELENISEIDFYGYNSDVFSIVSDTYMDILSSPFRILAGQKAVIYPRIYQYKSYNEVNGYSEGYIRYMLNNGVRDLYIPIEGTFKVSFTEKPEKLIFLSGIAFYYKNNLSQKPSSGFFSKGTLKRSLWKNDEIIASFNDIITDSTYNTYKICPEGEEIKDIPEGNYLLKCTLTDSNGFEWPTITLPLIIDEEELPISIEKVEFDTHSSFSYDDEIPVIVTVKNPTQQAFSTLLKTEMLKKIENSWYIEREELHAVTLSAEQSTTIKLNAHILSQDFRQEGTFKVDVSACRTKRDNGHLDFGASKRSETIMLPYDNTGIKHIEYNKERIPIAYYTMDGKRINQPPHGLYIIKYSDGKVEKKMR